MVEAKTFCEQLARRVAPGEWRLLERGCVGLVINEHNRTALLELRDAPVLAREGVDETQAAAFEAQIQGYLDAHMADAPEGHKWIVLASLYLTFVAARPMHPIERAGVVVREAHGRIEYLCPSKTPGDNPICDACVCEPMARPHAAR